MEMLEQERTELMPMPTVFDGYVERSAKVSSTCLVAVARNRYSVPCELAGQRVSTRLYPNRVEIASDELIVASHDASVEPRPHLLRLAALHRAGTAQARGLEKRRTLCRHARAIATLAPRIDAP
jgi:hypothetical protein